MRQLNISKQVTNREELSLDKYLNEVGRIGLLTTEEEIELAKKIKKGDQDALEILIKSNLRFVISVAKQYQNKGLSLPDLINEGNLGLIKAAQRFDETRGFKFISYGVWWIRQSIMQALAEQSRMIRLPLNRIGSITKIRKTYNRLEQEYHREPTSEEIAFFLEISVDEVEDALKVSLHHISMDAPIHDEEGNNLYDIILNDESLSPDNGLINNSLSNEIERSLSTLGKREADVIRYYFGLSGYSQSTLDEIGRELGLTRERVRQIKEMTMKKMKNNYRNKLLKAYL
ncbi:MAG TPA: RNA polymerase sigma factor RpoD/SigA [Prolixibacteraceae bacterium]|nr:RNA polymerase sigma factor RpoD/SigA [Prolixibacteraceae bacterium]